MDELPRQLALVESPALGCVDGRERPALLFDNATSTPPLQGVLDAVAAFLTWYGSVQRGAGRSSEVSTAAAAGARRAVRVSLGLGSSADAVETFLIALAELAERGPRFSYRDDAASGRPVPVPDPRAWPELPIRLGDRRRDPQFAAAPPAARGRVLAH